MNLSKEGVPDDIRDPRSLFPAREADFGEARGKRRGGTENRRALMGLPHSEAMGRCARTEFKKILRDRRQI